MLRVFSARRPICGQCCLRGKVLRSISPEYLFCGNLQLSDELLNGDCSEKESGNDVSSPPRIWLDYRPVRIGWVISDRSIDRLATMATWNTCLWGGRFNCVIPTHDTELAERLVSCFAVDVLLPVQPDDAAKAFIDRFPYLTLHRWGDSIFREGDCEFADIRHALRRIAAHQDQELSERFCMPVWDAGDQLSALFATEFGAYPTANADIADYKDGVKSALDTEDIQFSVGDELPIKLLERISPVQLTGYDTSMSRNRAPGTAARLPKVPGSQKLAPPASAKAACGLMNSASAHRLLSAPIFRCLACPMAASSVACRFPVCKSIRFQN